MASISSSRVNRITSEYRWGLDRWQPERPPRAAGFGVRWQSPHGTETPLCPLTIRSATPRGLVHALHAPKTASLPLHTLPAVPP